MTIDDLGRSAATAARDKAAREVEPTMMLRRLHRTHRTRIMVLASAAAGVVVLGTVLVARGLAPTTGQGPASPPSATPSAAASQSVDPCTKDGVTCLGTGRYRVALTVPVVVKLPPTFEGAFNIPGVSALEDYRNDVGGTGVTVMENAIPVRDDPSWTRDPTAGSTAASMATWLAHRPFLTGTAMTRTTVGGRSAWLVTGRLRPGTKLHGGTPGHHLAPTFGQADGNARFEPSLTGSYTLLDIPGAGVTVIWSWTTLPDSSVLAGNQAYVDALTFG